MSGADAGQARATIEKKRSFDEDLWVLEIEDIRCIYKLDAPLLDD
jgi:hypothetical protein